MKPIKILLLHKGFSSFVRADFELLTKHFEVQLYYLKPSKNVFGFFYYHFRFALFLLFNLRKFDLIYSWFGDYHAFNASVFTKLFGLKHIIVVGGNDAVSIPALEFGVYYKNNIRSKLVSQAYKNADAILSVDGSLIEGTNTYIDGDNIIGIEHFVPGIKQKCFVVPTGYNADYWSCKSDTKIDQVLTVGIVDSEKQAIRKGFDLIEKLADELPDVSFIFIGVEQAYTESREKRENLKVLHRVSQDELMEYYCKSKVFAQFSVSEGLPNTLCEAMLCKCIAIGSSANGIPSVIRNDELILSHRSDIAQAKKIVKKALNMGTETGEMNRDFIKKYYSAAIREKSIVKIIRDIV
jgi:glycosyltransferase involved in cell wall biosynthesis